MSDYLWSQDRINLLIKLWGEGYSASQVALRMGKLSRSAVIGKVYRLGLPPRRVNYRTKAETRKNTDRSRAVMGLRPAAHTRGIEALPLPPDPIPPPDFKGLSLASLEAGNCRWPKGDPEQGQPYTFCGCETLPQQSYCAYHHRIAWKPLQVSPRRQDEATAGRVRLEGVE